MDEYMFLVKDYELRIDYLNAHFGRMWTRFNFFLTLQSGLIAFMFIGNKVDFSANLPLFLLAEVTLSIIWWIFGAQDRWLAHAYRTSINKTAEKITEKNLAGEGYQAVGNYRKLFNKESPSVLKNPVEWYSPRTSITKLAAYVPPLTASCLAVIWHHQYVSPWQVECLGVLRC
jgi:hypothetical protein